MPIIKITSFKTTVQLPLSLSVELDNKTSLLLDNGFDVEVDVIPVDPFRITDKQRRKIFALVKDIEAHTGTPMDYMSIYSSNTFGLTTATTSASH